MMKLSSALFNAPIPGENLTVDTRGYPWHRPPAHPSYDEAFEFFTDNLFGDATRLGNISLLVSNGISLLAVTQSIMLQAVSGGKITPDVSLLIAGPVYKTLSKILDKLGVKYLTGYDSEEELAEFARYVNSGEMLKSMETSKPVLTEKQEEEMEQITEELSEDIPTGGLMGARSEDETSIEIPSEENGTPLVPNDVKETEGDN